MANDLKAKSANEWRREIESMIKVLNEGQQELLKCLGNLVETIKEVDEARVNGTNNNACLINALIQSLEQRALITEDEVLARLPKLQAEYDQLRSKKQAERDELESE